MRFPLLSAGAGSLMTCCYKQPPSHICACLPSAGLSSQAGVTAHPRMQNQQSLMCVLVRNTPESHQHFLPSSCVRGTRISIQACAFVLLTKPRYLVVLSIREEELTGFIKSVGVGSGGKQTDGLTLQ